MHRLVQSNVSIGGHGSYQQCIACNSRVSHCEHYFEHTRDGLDFTTEQWIEIFKSFAHSTSNVCNTIAQQMRELQHYYGHLEAIVPLKCRQIIELVSIFLHSRLESSYSRTSLFEDIESLSEKVSIADPIFTKSMHHVRQMCNHELHAQVHSSCSFSREKTINSLWYVLKRTYEYAIEQNITSTLQPIDNALEHPCRMTRNVVGRDPPAGNPFKNHKDDDDACKEHKNDDDVISRSRFVTLQQINTINWEGTQANGSVDIRCIPCNGCGTSVSFSLGKLDSDGYFFCNECSADWKRANTSP